MNRPHSFIRGLALVVLCLAPGPAAMAQDGLEDVDIRTLPVSGNVYMLSGQGGNIGVSAGEDGVLIIDDQYRPLSARIREALAALGDDSPRFVINTHFHGDHTGGNPAFGQQSLIVAHENVRGRLESESDMDAAGMPGMLYRERAALFFNGERVELFHMPAGHTDGDTVVLFTDSDVVHMGDLFFKDRFPVIDLENGGTVQGYIRNVSRVLEEMVGDNTRVIPGHGALAGRLDLERFLEMLRETVTEVRIMQSRDMDREEVVSRGLEERWSEWSWDSVSEQRWVKTIYDNYAEAP